MPGLVKRFRDLRVRLGYYRGPRAMSELRKRWAKFRNPYARIEFGRNTFCGPGFELRMPHGGTFIAGDGTEFRRNFLGEVGPEGVVTIGAGCYFTYDVIITCSTTVTIGDRVGLAQNTFIADGSHRYRDLDVPFLDQGYDFRPIVLEDDVQVHAKVTIVNSIGTRSVIGANAVISRAIPAYCLAAGVPARVLDYFGPAGLEPEGFTASSARSGAAPGRNP